MKKKIRFIDNIHKKETVTEVTIPAKDHLEAQKKYPAQVFVPKKFRKPKHKKKIFEEDN